MQYWVTPDFCPILYVEKPCNGVRWKPGEIMICYEKSKDAEFRAPGEFGRCGASTKRGK
jgi:hypothetical protein